MSLESNLVLAHAASDYALNKTPLGSSNKEEHLARAREQQGWTSYLSWEQPALTKDSVNNLRVKIRSQGEGLSGTEWALQAAELIEEAGLGNCGEQSVVAFKYLYHHAEADTFTLAALGKNHEFVVIGATPQQVNGTYPIDTAPGWPADAVICDPWHGVSFAVNAYWSREIKAILAKTEPSNKATTVEVIPRVNMIWTRNPAYQKK